MFFFAIFFFVSAFFRPRGRENISPSAGVTVPAEGDVKLKLADLPLADAPAAVDDEINPAIDQAEDLRDSACYSPDVDDFRDSSLHTLPLADPDGCFPRSPSPENKNRALALQAETPLAVLKDSTPVKKDCLIQPRATPMDTSPCIPTPYTQPSKAALDNRVAKRALAAIVIDSDSDVSAPEVKKVDCKPPVRPMLPSVCGSLASAPPPPPPPKLQADGSARAPIAIDSDDDLPSVSPACVSGARAGGAAPMYLGALRAQVAYAPDVPAFPVPSLHVAPSTKLCLIREVPGHERCSLLTRYSLF